MNQAVQRAVKWIGIPLLILILAGAGFYAWVKHRANAFAAFDWSYTVDTTPVKLQIGPHLFVIPKNYLFKKGTQKDGQYNWFTIVVLVPDMAPYSEELKDRFQKEFGTKIFIDISLRSAVSNVDVTTKFNNQRKNSSQKEATEALVSEVPGFKQYSDDGLNFDRFVLFKEDRIEHFMTCRQVGSAPSPHCEVQIDYPELFVEYTFSRSMIQQWRSVDEQVRNLVSRFQVR